ncbi:MAG: DUF4260 domain-containing protein [Cytophaga sp.]|uniref:DUF4260 domain-containing protein n=1 Tax=Cytophaga sp. TaxID=29535 RepID=UPI003F7CFBAB
MNVLLKLEEAALFILCLFLFSLLPFAWWWFPALLLVPDIAMLGYLINPKIGAYTYNLFHHRLPAATVACCGLYTGDVYWQLAAIILFAHISMDRLMGYGLKYEDSFHHTHLGMTGKVSK